jgi:hypothetical protein
LSAQLPRQFPPTHQCIACSFSLCFSGHHLRNLVYGSFNLVHLINADRIQIGLYSSGGAFRPPNRPYCSIHSSALCVALSPARSKLVLMWPHSAATTCRPASWPSYASPCSSCSVRATAFLCLGAHPRPRQVAPRSGSGACARATARRLCRSGSGHTLSCRVWRASASAAWWGLRTCRPARSECEPGMLKPGRCRLFVASLQYDQHVKDGVMLLIGASQYHYFLPAR